MCVIGFFLTVYFINGQSVIFVLGGVAGAMLARGNVNIRFPLHTISVIVGMGLLKHTRNFLKW